MRQQMLFAVILCAFAAPVAAQTPPANPKPETPAIDNRRTSPLAPAKGENSFTMAQAKSRIEAGGFTDVNGLAKDRDGVWRGKAMKDGATHDVALDYQGKLFARPVAGEPQGGSR